MNHPDTIYKIVAADAWRAAEAAGRFTGAGVDLRDGYIHFSTAAQVPETAARHFAGQTGLLLVGVSTAALGDALKWEPSRGGDLFPHLYGELPMAAVVTVDVFVHPRSESTEAIGQRDTAGAPARPRRLLPWLAVAAAASIGLAVYMGGGRAADRPAPDTAPSPAVPDGDPTDTAARAAGDAAAATRALPFAKAEVRLSAAALTWSGAGGLSPYLQSLKPAVDAYRDGQYAEADRLFTGLRTRYPSSIEILFYQGVTRMMLGEFSEAVPLLHAAAGVDDPAFAADAAWYLGVAEERAGLHAAARARLDRLCHSGGGRRDEACAAVAHIDAVIAARP